MNLRPKSVTEKNKFFNSLKEGITLVASIVKRTLGPGGLPILIERVGQNLEGDPLEPMITKDGVTVASECAHEDEYVDVVIQTVKSICKKTNTLAGDGTTTAIVLGEAIFNEGLEQLTDNPSLNPQLLKEALERVVNEDIIPALEEQATPVGNDLEKIKQVATISANGDEEIGEIIKNAFSQVGAEGVITIDEGHSVDTTIEVVDGFQFNRGAEGGDRFFNNQEGTQFDAEDVYVVLYDGDIKHHGQVGNLLKKMNDTFVSLNYNSFPPIVFVANNFSQDTLQYLLIQKANAGFNVCCVKGPNVTNIRTMILDDLAVVLDAKRLGNGNTDLENAEFGLDEEGNIVGDVGMAGRVVIDKYTSTFYDGVGEEEAVIERIEKLKVSREQAFSEYDRAQINDRIGSLSRGIAKIGVGGRTELEIKEKYHRIEDALNAARAAIGEGIIPGGGAPLFRIAEEMKNKKEIEYLILSKALKAPLKQILENIGLELKDIYDPDALNDDETTYDARNKQYVSALEAGIIDPVKVTKIALQNAMSIASLLLTCGGAITFKRAKK